MEKALYQGLIFGGAEIISGEQRKMRGKGVVRRKVLAAKVPYRTWRIVRAAARERGCTVSTLLESVVKSGLALSRKISAKSMD